MPARTTDHGKAHESILMKLSYHNTTNYFCTKNFNRVIAAKTSLHILLIDPHQSGLFYL